jgi:flagellar hook-associated protein 3 FlgL
MLDLQLNLTRILSEEQDLDYAEAIMELKMEEFAYRTALAVGARIIQPSLVDFLR